VERKRLAAQSKDGFRKGAERISAASLDWLQGVPATQFSFQEDAIYKFSVPDVS